MIQITRKLFCPICGFIVTVDVQYNGKFPEIHAIPDHVPLGSVNLCTAMQIVVSIDHHKCSLCGRNMINHLSQLCGVCWAHRPTQKDVGPHDRKRTMKGDK